MSLYTLDQRLFLPRGREEVFTFFSTPENLAIITPPWLGFSVLTPSPVPMFQGAVIDYLLHLGPFPSRWRSMITAFEPPHRFVDEQMMGPYSFWHHTHVFEARDDGTLITDRIQYLLPMGVIGRLVHSLVVKRRLEAIFAHRRREIGRIFGVRDERDTV